MTSYICTHTYVILIEIFSNCQLLSFIRVILFDFMYERKRKKKLLCSNNYFSSLSQWSVIFYYFILLLLIKALQCYSQMKSCYLKVWWWWQASKKKVEEHKEARTEHRIWERKQKLMPCNGAYQCNSSAKCAWERNAHWITGSPTAAWTYSNINEG